MCKQLPSGGSGRLVAAEDSGALEASTVTIEEIITPGLVGTAARSNDGGHPYPTNVGNHVNPKDHTCVFLDLQFTLQLLNSHWKFSFKGAPGFK